METIKIYIRKIGGFEHNIIIYNKYYKISRQRFRKYKNIFKINILNINIIFIIDSKNIKIFFSKNFNNYNLKNIRIKPFIKLFKNNIIIINESA